MDHRFYLITFLLSLIPLPSTLPSVTGLQQAAPWQAEACLQLASESMRLEPDRRHCAASKRVFRASPFQLTETQTGAETSPEIRGTPSRKPLRIQEQSAELCGFCTEGFSVKIGVSSKVFNEDQSGSHGGEKARIRIGRVTLGPTSHQKS